MRESPRAAPGRPVPDPPMVFQSPALLPWRTTIDNIVFSADMRGRRGGDARECAQALVRLAGLGRWSGFETCWFRRSTG